MAYTPVRPTDPLDNPSHSGLHNQHATDIDEINEAQAEQDDKITALETLNETLAGGNAGEVLGKSTNDDYDWEWIPAPSGGDGTGDIYPGISTEQPNGIGIGTDGGLQVDPATLLSDADGQSLTLDDVGKIYGTFPELGPVGKVLQVVQEFYQTPTEVASDSYQDAGGSVTITPSDAASKVLVQIEIALHLSCTTNDDVYGYVQLMRNGVPIQDFGNVNRIRAAVGLGGMTHVTARSPITFLDSPSATSACTYSLEIKVNSTANARKIIAHGVGAVATFTAMEVAQ